MTVKPKKLNHKWQVQSLRSGDANISIRYALYRNSDKPLRRCVVYFNGRTEWIEKNMEIPEWLELPEDCGFLTLDHRGQGMSGGARAYIDSYDTYVADARNVINTAIKDIPFVMLSHSMGGLIALYGTLRNKFQPRSMVLCSPLLRLPNLPVPRILARPLAGALSKWGGEQWRTGAGRFEKSFFVANKLTHSSEMFEVISNTPYHVPSATFGWVDQTFLTLDWVFKEENFRKLSVPTLILSASEDQVVDVAGQKEFVQKASDKVQVELALERVYGARHELFSEIEEYRKIAIGKIRTWLKDFLS